MPKHIRSKNNEKYMQVIPKKGKGVLRNEKALNVSRKLAELVRERLIVMEQSQEIRQKLYNLSRDIHEFEVRLVDIFKEDD